MKQTKRKQKNAEDKERKIVKENLVTKQRSNKRNRRT